MAITIKKLQGCDIPSSLRAPDVHIVFDVEDSAGQHYTFTDEKLAAAKAVELSEHEKKDGGKP